MTALPPSPNLPFADVVDLVAFGRAKMAFGLSDIDEHAAQLRTGIADADPCHKESQVIPLLRLGTTSG